MTEPKKNSIISGSATAVIMGLIILACALMGLYPPDPIPAEEGVEVNLGNSDFGLGNNPIPDASEANDPSAAKPSAAEEVATQSTEESVALNANQNKGNTVASKRQTEVTQETPKEPKINSNALFKKKSNNTNGGSQGVTSGNGNQGKEGGDPNSNRYDGRPGNGGAGFSLAGREAKALPWPKYESNQQGKIVVKIWVDRNGNVTKAKAGDKGTTIANRQMQQLTERAAMKAKFSVSESAGDVQVGTITYVFKVQ